MEKSISPTGFQCTMTINDHIFKTSFGFLRIFVYLMVVLLNNIHNVLY